MVAFGCAVQGALDNSAQAANTAQPTMAAGQLQTACDVRHFGYQDDQPKTFQNSNLVLLHALHNDCHQLQPRCSFLGSGFGLDRPSASPCDLSKIVTELPSSRVGMCRAGGQQRWRPCKCSGPTGPACDQAKTCQDLLDASSAFVQMQAHQDFLVRVYPAAHVSHQRFCL